MGASPLQSFLVTRKPFGGGSIPTAGFSFTRLSHGFHTDGGNHDFDLNSKPFETSNRNTKKVWND